MAKDPLQALTDFMEVLHVWTEPDDGDVRIECTYCSDGDYLFTRSGYPEAGVWVPAMISHLRTRHPEAVATLLGRT